MINSLADRFGGEGVTFVAVVCDAALKGCGVMLCPPLKTRCLALEECAPACRP